MARSVTLIKVYTAGLLFLLIQWTAVDGSAALFLRFTPRTLAAHCVPVDREATAAI